MKYTQLGFFDAENKYEKLSELGDPLEKLNDIINWEMFREKLTAVCQKEDYTKGGRPAIDVIIKFTPSQLNFHKEHAYYEHIAPGIMADLVDAVPDYNALVLKMVKPGFQVSVDPDNPEIQRFFQKCDFFLICHLYPSLGSLCFSI